MAIQALTLSLLAEYVADTGDTPNPIADIALSVSEFDEYTVTRKLLANAADSEVFNLLSDELAALIVYSRDYPFSLELATGESLLANGRLFVWMGDDVDEAAFPNASILLTGNTTNDSALVIIQVLAVITP